MLKAVSNSGPIIHLNEINQLDLLRLFSDLTVPNSVANEIGETLSRNIGILEVEENEIRDFVKNIKEFNLQNAEIDALYLAEKFNAIFLTDDLQARDAANKLKIEVHGSIGIIVLSYKKKLLSLNEAKNLIKNLHEKSTLFLTKSLVDLAIRELEKIKLKD